MSTSLKHNLTSAYLDAARKLSPKRARRRIVAYVESYDDIAFWRTLLSEFENEERYFQVMLPSATSLAKGKKMVLMNTLNTSELGRSLIACVDSDYDFLLQGATKVSHKINKNPYIFQTYGYAIENFHCFADSLHEVCVQATLNDRHILDFPAFLKRYSQIAYPLFLWNVWFYRQHDTHTFPMYDFNACVRLQEINLRHPYRSLDVRTASPFPPLHRPGGAAGHGVGTFGTDSGQYLSLYPRTPYHGLCSAENPYPGMYGAAS